MTELTDTYNIYVNTVRFISDFVGTTHFTQVHMTSMVHRYGAMTDKYGYIQQVIDFDDNINDINLIITCTVS